MRRKIKVLLPIDLLKSENGEVLRHKHMEQIQHKPEKNSALKQNQARIFDTFDSWGHNFDARATKIIGCPDLCNTKVKIKFNRIPKKNCGL